MGRKYRSLKKPFEIGKRNKGKNDEIKSKRLQETVSRIESTGEDALHNVVITDNIEDNYKKAKEIFKDCSDVILRKFTFGTENTKCFIVYLSVMVDKDQINEAILNPLMTDTRITQLNKEIEIENLIMIIKDSSIYSGEVEVVPTFKGAVNNVLIGNCVLFVDGNSSVLAFSTVKWEGRKVAEARIEPTVLGPQDAFVEDLQTNISLVRRRIKTPDLKMEKMEIGRLSKTSVVVSYIKGVSEEGTVEEIKKRLNNIDIDAVIDSGYIKQLIQDNSFSPFPQLVVTERPDRSVGALAEGRVVIMVDGSPFVLIAPATLVDFLAASEDYYLSFYFSTFLRILRYICFGIALLGPSVYIAVTTFHQEMVPRPLLVTIARARAEIPFPAIVEAFLMEFTFEILREAGIRLPQPVGPAVSIVGGLVIGQGAVQAGIVSQSMVIVVAVTGIASFALPAFNAAISLRVLRFPFMILAATLGIYGIIMGLLALLVHLAGLRSMGVPYLSPASPLSIKDLKDTIVKFPLWALSKRPTYIQRKNIRRMKKRLKPEPPKQR